MPLHVPFQIDNLVELAAVLRHLRIQRDRLQEELVKLEEKLKTHSNGTTRGAILALAADISLLDEAIKRAWVSYSGGTDPKD